MIKNSMQLTGTFLMAVIMMACNAGSQKATSASSQEEIKALPFIEVTSPADGANITEGSNIVLKFELPKEVNKADSFVVSFNDKKILSGSGTEITIPSKGLKMGRQGINIQAFAAGSAVAEKYLSVVVKPADSPVKYTYSIIKTYPHDTHAYTQGLTFDNNILYEGTGQRGESKLKIVDLNTGKTNKSIDLEDKYFGEGIAIIGDKIFQLTWQEQRGFVYNKKTLEKIRDFMYPGEGWGLTTDGKVLFLSDGSNSIRILDPEKLMETGKIEVYDNNGPIEHINELEYINGEIWANIYMTDNIVRIDPTTGKVTGIINFKGLLPDSDRTSETDVLNGIAYNPISNKIYVTGKYWPKLYEIKVTKM